MTLILLLEYTFLHIISCNYTFLPWCSILGLTRIQSWVIFLYWQLGNLTRHLHCLCYLHNSDHLRLSATLKEQLHHLPTQ